jgi:hypothetical protein
MEEIIARVIELGRDAIVPDPHTVYIVEDPGKILPYPSRSRVDNICYALPIEHLTKFPYSYVRMVRTRMTFYRHREAALADATVRAQVFRRVVMLAHNDFEVYIYETPCGMQTYYKNRKRHNWVWKGPDGERQEFGENYSAACDHALANGGWMTLELDGKPLNPR